MSNETTTETQYRAARLFTGEAAPIPVTIPVSDWGSRDDAVDAAGFAEATGSSGRVVVQQRTVTYGPIVEADRAKLIAEYGSDVG